MVRQLRIAASAATRYYLYLMLPFPRSESPETAYQVSMSRLIRQSQTTPSIVHCEREEVIPAMILI